MTAPSSSSAAAPELLASHAEQLGLTFSHGGHTLVYDEIGSGDHLVVYLHGLLMDSRMNRGIARSLAERGSRVVLLDLLGHGRSDHPTHASEYRMDTYADQVVALLDHLGVETAVLGGVSLGANVSLQVAVRNPDRVRGLVLEMPVLEWAVPAAALVFAPMVLAARYLRGPFDLLSRAINALPETPIDALNSAVFGMGVGPDVIAAVLHGILVGPVAPTVEQRRAVTVPALVMAHRNDLIHPFDDAENLAEQLPNGTLVRAHSPLELRVFPTRLTAEIATFVDATCAPPPAPRRARKAATPRS